MKRLLLVLFLILPVVMHAGYRGGEQQILLQKKNGANDHLEHFIPIDQPSVYYDSNNQMLIIDGLGEVSYYDVEITPIVSNNPVITTQVDGNYDTIDVSSLWSGGFVISIESPTGNIFEGTFYID